MALQSLHQSVNKLCAPSEDVDEDVVQKNIDAVCEETDENVGENQVLVLKVLRQNDVHERTLIAKKRNIKKLYQLRTYRFSFVLTIAPGMKYSKY